MVNDEELKVLKMIGSEAKLDNLWLKVYDDKTEKEGLISVLEIFKIILKTMEDKK